MDRKSEEEVRNRAEGRCEYCLHPQKYSRLKFPLDHVIARQHGGEDAPDNLALACGFCNLHKGPNISGIDPDTGRLTRLFNPRQDDWRQHFCWSGARLVGLTPIGRTTIRVLAINHPHQIAVRQALIDEEVFP
jgi:hypothetical protein